MALKFVIWFLLVAVTYGQFCGNGNLQTFFGEECDDNNRDDDDGCSGDCEIEDGWNCTKISGQTSKCKPICGDRKLHGYENCDDANTLPNDGCSSNCTIEVGWDCEKEDSNDPSVCSTICGDGLIKGTEQCDDNNTISDDGCERNCTISTNEDWLCLGEPSVCTVDDIEDDQENKGASKGTRAAIGVVLTLLVIGLVVAGIIIAMRMRPDLKEKAKEKFNAVTKRGGRNANRESHNPMYEEGTEMSKNNQTAEKTATPPPKPEKPVSMRLSSLSSSITIPKTPLSGSTEVPKLALSVSRAEVPEVADYARHGNATFPPNQNFGIPIDCVKMEGNIPFIVEHLLSHLEKTAITEEGIMRLAGSVAEMKRLKEVYEQGQVPDLNKFDVHAVAGVMKMWFRELPKHPLMMTKGLKQAVEMEDEARWQAVRHELYSVPELNFYTLKRLFGFCHKVTKNSKQTKMLPQNIAIVFHPTLNLPMELITSMVAKYEEIFAD
eukprot:TRINITY_DN2264_c0_g1_i2.p1 TRINITY_DN2264_c0_g1~~TRINITY_DN2264_c0_g1_i2.p1  ORF type:complete len:493 (+),score=108.90 TRINITY_DN2264_c0_g1_i2:2-1480(+)